MPHLAEQTPYEVLEVPIEASADQIEAAYRHMTSMVANDSLALYAMMGEDEATHLRALVEEAYALLSDSARRAAYDGTQRRGGGLGPRDAAPAAARLHAMAQLDASEGEQAVKSQVQPSLVASPETIGRPAYAPRPFVKRPMFEAHPAEPLSADTIFTGALLRELRESAGASLVDLENATKIGHRYLTALESDNYAALPAAVYVRGFVTQYARSLGLNPPDVVRSYMQQMDNVQKR